ncbi:phage major capsid protein [Helicobacter jaachi]|uniref:Phage major capsid protein n=1 Tax=Helicobacter jaachi TaxID=1677920 RepID=A0A4U8TCV4_9HELI|nr:phage major capsid protein [Helicobacter jaachi]TLD97663.1 phage major capsid protein [Helicobacter jaachi]
MNLKNFSIDLHKKAINESDYTISFVALSEKPLIRRTGVLGDFYISIDTRNVIFNAKTFYLDHNVSFANAIGNIIEVKREGGDIKVKVQFHKDIEESKNAFIKYKKGLSNSVSVGFGETHIEELEPFNDCPHYFIKSGEVVELSAVWQGADPNAIIKEFAQQHTQGVFMPTQEQNITHAQGSQAQDTQESARIIELALACKQYEKGLSAIAQNMSYFEFSKSLLQEGSFTQNSMSKEPKERQLCFSLSNYAHNVASGDNAREIELQSGVNGYVIDNAFLNRFEATKSIDTTSTGFIPEYYREDKFIEQVFAQSSILSLCDKLTGLNGTLRIPRDTSDVKAYWVKEGEKTTTSKLSADSITLSPRTLKAKILITRQMLNMSPFALESFIIERLKLAIRLKLEEDLLYGGGSGDSDPITGIFNTSGVQSIENYFTDTNYKKTLEFGGKLSAANYSIADTHFATNSKGMVHLQATHYDADSDKYLLNERATYLAGYKYFMNNLIKDNHAIFGDFKNALVGTWGNLQVQALKDDEGDLVFTGFYDIGIELKRPNGFVIAKS